MTINDAYQTLFTSYPDVLGVKEITKMLGVGKPVAYRLIHEGHLKTIPLWTVFQGCQNHRHRVLIVICRNGSMMHGTGVVIRPPLILQKGVQPYESKRSA